MADEKGTDLEEKKESKPEEKTTRSRRKRGNGVEESEYDPAYLEQQGDWLLIRPIGTAWAKHNPDDEEYAVVSMDGKQSTTVSEDEFNDQYEVVPPAKRQAGPVHPLSLK